MNKSEIYYFSGTGNSLKLAKDISNNLNATLIPVVSLFDKKEVYSDANIIGIVFPIYDFKAPEIIDDLISKLHVKKSVYIFAICTYGVLPLRTMKKLQKRLDENQLTLSSGFTVKMPHNGLGYAKIPKERQQEMFDNWDKKRLIIIDHIRNRKTSKIEINNPIYYAYLLLILFRMIPILFRMFKQIMFHGWQSLGFNVNKNCNACGICEHICPVDNILIKDDVPFWSDKCINCFACLHWCPKRAINAANLTVNMHRYHHPDVNIKEIINQKNNTI